jgi:hypothetical protein
MASCRHTHKTWIGLFPDTSLWLTAKGDVLACSCEDKCEKTEYCRVNLARPHYLRIESRWGELVDASLFLEANQAATFKVPVSKDDPN